MIMLTLDMLQINIFIMWPNTTVGLNVLSLAFSIATRNTVTESRFSRLF